MWFTIKAIYRTGDEENHRRRNLNNFSSEIGVLGLLQKKKVLKQNEKSAINKIQKVLILLISYLYLTYMFSRSPAKSFRLKFCKFIYMWSYVLHLLQVICIYSKNKPSTKYLLNVVRVFPRVLRQLGT